MNSNKNLNLWLWLSEKRSLNCNKKYKLYNHFGSIESIYNADYADYKKLRFLNDEDAHQLSDKEADYKDLIKLYTKHSVKLVSFDMPEYPDLLKEIANPPLLLYMRGCYFDLNEYLLIGMVGTRNSTSYGEATAYNLAKDLASNGAIIVSGMANGIDTKAHEGALAANMPTVAIIGCGVNICYPKTNSALMKKIMETGLVISEYPINEEPKKYHFPERNRIISGLSRGVVVVEADIKSGSLITAKYAYEQNRDVFAVPGNINSLYSKGTNYLIKDGACLTTCSEDVLYSYKEIYSRYIIKGMNYNKIKHINRMNEINEQYVKRDDNSSHIERNLIQNNEVSQNTPEEIIMSIISKEPVHIDKICELSKLPMKDINSTLLYLEIEEKIISHPGNCYSRNTNQEEI